MYCIDKRLTELMVRELPLNRRQQLCSYLNNEQVLMSECGLARDYRGVAQQLDLSYNDIAQLEKMCDPCGSLLNHQKVSKLTVYDLFELLVSIGRFDILDDMIPLILDELTLLNDRKKHHQNEVTLLPVEEENTIWYDAYVCYADSDLDFVKRLAEYLESPQIGFRLFIRDRDLLVGNWVYETFARLIETQCRRMILILSPDFLKSHDCKFQSVFATGLAIEKCSRILVPIIYKPCNELPSMLRLMSKIDMSGSTNTIPEWSIKRLVKSIQEQPSNKKQETIEFKNNQNDQNKDSNEPNQNSISILQKVKKELNLNQPQTYSETIPLNLINTHSNHNQTNISVISNENYDSERLIKNSNLFIENTSLNDDIVQNSVNRNRSRNWIKTIKNKIKVAF